VFVHGSSPFGAIVSQLLPGVNVDIHTYKVFEGTRYKVFAVPLGASHLVLNAVFCEDSSGRNVLCARLTYKRTHHSW